MAQQFFHPGWNKRIKGISKILFENRIELTSVKNLPEDEFDSEAKAILSYVSCHYNIKKNQVDIYNNLTLDSIYSIVYCVFYLAFCACFTTFQNFDLLYKEKVLKASEKIYEYLQNELQN